jgi:hypothetical protein
VTGTTQAGSVPLVQQDSPARTPSGADVAERVAQVPPFTRSPIDAAYDEAAREVGPAVAASFTTGAPVDLAAVSGAFDRAVKRAKGR